MLLFSTILDIKKNVSKEDFINLVVEWNNTSKYKENIIEGVKWNGEDSVKFGDEKLWLNIEIYENIVAVRYEKIADNNAIWDTDYVMNFDTMKLAIRLDRSYREEVDISTTNFSTPHFITLLIEHDFLEKDGKLPVSRKPIVMTEKKVKLVSEILKGEHKYRFPVVYISKTKTNSNSVDVEWMASRLKGVAHVIVEEDKRLNKIIKRFGLEDIEENGDVGIYFPKASLGHRKYIYRRILDSDNSLLERVVHRIIRASVVYNFPALYTWQGVNHAILRRNIEKQIRDRKLSEEELIKDRDEAYLLIDEADNDISKMQSKIKELMKINEALTLENNGLRNKISTKRNAAVIYAGCETDFYPEEIKEIILAALSDTVANLPTNTRRSDVLKDILENNEYTNTLGKKQQEIKRIFKGYKNLNASVKQDLTELGFEIKEDGKHYRLTYYGDDRYFTTVAKTPSDGRSGSNVAGEICRDFL